MAIPAKAAGAGNGSTARNVYAISVSQPLSAAPQFEAYDGGTFPAVGSGTTVTGKALAGTAGNGSRSMLALVSTGAAAPSSSWKPANATAGAANPNRVKGQTSYVTAQETQNGGAGVGAWGVAFSKAAGALGNATGAIDSATNPAGVIRWNEAFEMPSDVAPTDNLTHDLLVRYQYTGSAPTLKWYFNDAGAGGVEATPVWTELTPGTHGVRHCNAGTVSGGPYKLDIPPSGTVDASEAWITG
jgi:hypothetical protein